MSTENIKKIGTVSKSAPGMDLEKVVGSLPPPTSEVMHGVPWGRHDILYTPAFWKVQYHLMEMGCCTPSHIVGETAVEEVVRCLLGGFGLTSEISSLAFQRLRHRKLIVKGVEEDELRAALFEPLLTGSGRKVRYRFYNQKSKYVSEFLNRSDIEKGLMKEDLAFRQWLTTVNGIGLKTASWITRNLMNSQNVAILDVHLVRAGKIAGIFDRCADVSRSYLDLESKFLNFCSALQVRPSDMDALIWINMKRSNQIALRVLNH